MFSRLVAGCRLIPHPRGFSTMQPGLAANSPPCDFLSFFLRFCSLCTCVSGPWAIRRLDTINFFLIKLLSCYSTAPHREVERRAISNLKMYMGVSSALLITLSPADPEQRNKDMESSSDSCVHLTKKLQPDFFWINRSTVTWSSTPASTFGPTGPYYHAFLFSPCTKNSEVNSTQHARGGAKKNKHKKNTKITPPVLQQ